jgi:hypothetical protein
MTKSIGAAVVVLAFIFGDLIPIVSVAAAPLQATVRGPSSAAAEPGTRRRIRHYRTFAQPYYLDRPYYYAPAPFLAFNFGYPIGPRQ